MIYKDFSFYNAENQKNRNTKTRRKEHSDVFLNIQCKIRNSMFSYVRDGLNIPIYLIFNAILLIFNVFNVRI